jgi:poly(beta-D-mannuronate) C5 epimerase
MIIFDKGFASVIALTLFSVTILSTPQLQFSNASTACIGYQGGVNTITITCDASFLDVTQAINDPAILQQGEEGQYILNANLEVADGVTFEMTSNGADNLQYLKIAGQNGIIVYGKILIDGVIITSWDVSEDEVIQQDMNGTIPRGYIQFAASEGAQIINSEFGYLGYSEPGRRGYDLFGGGGPSHDMEIRGSKFHDMWMAFYSNGAYNIIVDGNEYYNNIKYALDPHTATYNMNITNNWLHHNWIGAICSDDCFNILIEGNVAEHNSNAGIFLSRNMTNSIARNNNVYNSSTGILVSESPNNQIYNNTIDGATEEGILLLDPEIPDEGALTEGNLVYNNIISSSENGIRASRSHDNIVQNTTFSDISSSEYVVSGNASMIISGQEFDDDDDVLIAGGSGEENLVEIRGSGTIEVTEVANDGGEDDDDDDDEEEGEDSYNTDNEPYRKTLSEGDTITVNS